MVNLNKLPAFAAVYRLRSVALAAKHLHVTPSAVSIAIKTLEREVNGALFSRVGRRFVPTAFGERLHELAAPFLHALGETIEDHRMERTELAGNLRIGAAGGFGAHVLVRMAGEFVRRHPSVRAVIRMGGVRFLIHLLMEGEIGLAIVGKGVALKRYPQLASAELNHRYDLRLVCSRQFFANEIGRRSLARLSTLSHIALLDAPNRLNEWYRFNVKSATRPRVVLTVDSVFGAIAAARQHLGLALLPSDVIAEELQSGNLVEIGKPLASPSFRYQLLQLKDRVTPRVEKAFVSAVIGGLSLG